MRSIAQESLLMRQPSRHQQTLSVRRYPARDSTDANGSPVEPCEINKLASEPARISPRTRILSAAAELFSQHGFSAAGVDAIARTAGTNKMTLYYHFASKDGLVTEYLRESAKQTSALWARIDSLAPAGAAAQLSAWLAEMAHDLVDGGGCRFTKAAVELGRKSHPAQRVLRSYKVLQRRRLTRLCRAAGLKTPSMLADALLLLFEGACVMAPSLGPAGISARFVQLGEAMIGARARRRCVARLEHHA
jgi:AcrR family transcriptional regulator